MNDIAKRREFLKSSLIIGGASLVGWSGYLFKVTRDFIWQPNYEGTYAQPQVFHSFDSIIRMYDGREHDKPAVFCIYSLDCSSCIDELKILAEVQEKDAQDGTPIGEHIDFYFVDWDIWQLEDGRRFVYSQSDYEEGLTSENLEAQLESEEEYAHKIMRLRREGLAFTPVYATPEFHRNYNIRLVP